MKLLKISLKNIFQNKTRTLTLGFFILIASAVYIVLNSFIYTMNSGMIGALKYSLTGDIQIRSSSQKQNIVSTDASDQTIKNLSAKQSDSIAQCLDSDKNKVEGYVGRVLIGSSLTANNKRSVCTVIGLDADSEYYKKPMHLVAGDYLKRDSGDKIIITKSTADTLKASVGDKIKAFSTDKNGKASELSLEIAGIVKIERTSSLGDGLAYVNLKSAQKLAGLSSGEYTDFILYEKNSQKDAAEAENLHSQLNSTYGVSKLKISTWKEQGGYILDLMNMFSGLFYFLIVILMIIICTLILNMVFLMGIERRREVGTLRAIGFSRFKVVRIFMYEILMITVAFFVFGDIVGTIIITALGKVDFKVGSPMDMMMGSNFYVGLPDVLSFVIGFIIIFAVAILAGLYPSFKIASLKPVEVLKED